MKTCSHTSTVKIRCSTPAADSRVREDLGTEAAPHLHNLADLLALAPRRACRVDVERNLAVAKTFGAAVDAPAVWDRECLSMVTSDGQLPLANAHAADAGWHLHLVLLLAGRIEDADLRQAYVARQARPAERVARPVLEGDRGVAAAEASLT